MISIDLDLICSSKVLKSLCDNLNLKFILFYFTLFYFILFYYLIPGHHLDLCCRGPRGPSTISHIHIVYSSSTVVGCWQGNPNHSKYAKESKKD